ncbi:hypothetical protein UR09_04785 [Candidatus Nitromaritima sp. SCGC AAA799-A02]|nr:hypothetical protein UR09_04785 [Candidatus Nitromaritima sp. SCGC AAA799-A02]
MDKKIRILFVDDEPVILDSLKRMLRSMSQEWEVGFANSGQEALKTMEKESYDVVVTDMRMPGMDGAQLLEEIKKRFPETARIILSGQTGQKAFIRAAKSAHQFLTKPCDTETLKENVERIFSLRKILADQELMNLVAQIESLPSPPELYHLLREELESANFTLERVGEIISKDASMTAKILQLANSAFFGFSEKISTPSHAVQVLGLDIVKALILALGIFSEFEKRVMESFSIDRLWKHNLLVGEFARKIVQAENEEQKMENQAAIAGLLHDIGKLVIAANLPDQFRKILLLASDRKIPYWEAEREVLKATHAELGGYLLGLWGLLDPIVEAVVYHQFPSQCKKSGFSPLTAVHVANILEHRAESDQHQSNAQIDEKHLKELGLLDRLSEWEKRCGEKSDQS